MAIDTENKRRSVIEIPGMAVSPVADGDIGPRDRAASTWIYAGILTPITEVLKTFLMRIREIDVGVPGIMALTCVEDDAGIYSFPGIGGAASLRPPASGIFLPGSTRLELLDIPILKDADDAPGYYAAVSAFTQHWRGTVIFQSKDGGENFDELETILDEAVIGFTEDKLATGPTTVFDNTNSVIVRVIRGTLSSVSEINILNGANAVLIGTEVLQFQTAVLNGDGTFTLSKLLRGRRGTEHAVGTHDKNDTFVMLSAGGVNRIESNADEINMLRHYRAVSNGTLLENAATVPFTDTGVALKPFSPVHIAGTRDGSLNLTTTWIRRTRVGGGWRDLSDVPLGEDTEDYEEDILSGATVKRTITKTTSAGGSVVTPASQTALYTAADQITDFGSEQSSVDAEIFQLSAILGRGYKGEATV